MQKLILIILIAVLLILLLASCQKKPKEANQKPFIITTIYPYELIVRELVDTLFTVDTLLPANASPHTWSPSPQDMLRLQKADVVLSNGLGLETNLDKTLNQFGKKHIIASSFVNQQLLLADDEHGLEGVNPHIWTTPEFLTGIIIGLRDELSKRYPVSKAIFESNSRQMIMEINRVDGKIRREKDKYPKAAIVTLHDAFAYFFDYFKIEYVGSVQPSAGKDPAPKQLQELADKIKAKQIKAIFIEPQMNPKPAETLAQELNLKVLKYDDLGTTLGAKTISEYLWLNWIALKAGF